MNMNFNIIASNSIYFSFFKVLEKLDFNNKKKLFKKHIFIVPDKCTLNVEQQIFEKLKIDCFFDIEVVTLSNLTASILKNVSKPIISKQASIMLINNLLHKNASELNVFKNAISFNGFSENLFETISQFKSCEIFADELKIKSENNLTKLKVKDIKYIYEKYENHLFDNALWDNFDRLKIATENLCNTNYNNTAFYFAYFNSLTSQQINFLKKLVLVAGEINFACSLPIHQTNGALYSKELFNSLTQITDKQPNIEFYDATLNANVQHILKNAFAINYKKIEIIDNFINLFECPSIEQEITHIAKLIKSIIVFNKEKYNNFAILCCDYQIYKPIIKQIFKNYCLPVFFDESICLSEHFYAKNILNLLKIIINNFEKNDVINFSKSYFSTLSTIEQDLFENIILKYGIDRNKFKKLTIFKDDFANSFDSINKYFDKLIELQKIFNKKDGVTNKIKVLQQYLTEQGYKSKLENAILSFNLEKNLVWQKFTEEVFDSVDNIFDEISKTFQDTQLTNEELYNIIESGFLSAKLNLIPTAVDNIFVGDINSSFIMPTKNLIIVGASESNLPAIKHDCGLLIDAELKQFEKSKIEPTIREINKRTKFFEFQQLLNAKESLILSYSSFNSKQKNMPSSFMKTLQNIFEFNGKQLPIIQTKFLEEKLNNEILEKYFSSNFYNKKSTLLFLKRNQNNKALKNCNEILMKKLHITNTFFIEKNKDESLNLTTEQNKELFFKNNKISASQLECYFSCPYKHFYRYAIKPTQREMADLRPVDVGTLLHFIAQTFIQNYNEKLTKEELSKLSEKYFTEAIRKMKLENENNFFIKGLKEETFRLIEKLYFEKKHSKFDTYAVEKQFSQNNIFNDLNFYGLVDRIDIFENHFRIIDYKSISSNTSSSIDLQFKKIFSGQKLQLFLYAEVVEKILNKQLAGVFYFPIKNTFTLNSQDNNTTILKGYYLNNSNIIEAMDLNDNNIIELKTSNSLTNDELNDLKDYVITISANAISEILEGNIAPSPIYEDEQKNSCTYCEFKAMCKFDVKENGARQINEKIDKQFFGSVKNEK